MSLFRIGIKLFASNQPGVPLLDFIPVFHRWIRDQVYDGPLLDVADYSHVHHGPGILLAGYDANYSMDAAQGELGLVWYNKRPSALSTLDLARTGAARILDMSARLEQEPEFAGRLRFDTSRILLFANDRLAAPNDDEGWRDFEPVARALAALLFGEGNSQLNRERDLRERLSASIRASEAQDAAKCRERLAG